MRPQIRLTQNSVLYNCATQYWFSTWKISTYLLRKFNSELL